MLTISMVEFLIILVGILGIYLVMCYYCWRAGYVKAVLEMLVDVDGNVERLPWKVQERLKKIHLL